ncbi:MAG: hypothetical protein MASP_01738 [Candidatus Methanolliviera sp. GoM_asphalt]|nr:MAG: hypothetical protein MASP_01738 [Candidatus Methanolliviera sp. GoM_asphalt]
MMEQKQRRKIHFQGRSFLITLPMDWVRQNKLEKGDCVRISEEKNGSLKINGEVKDEK